MSCRWRATSPTRATGPDRRGGRRRIDLVVNNASALGPCPHPRSPTTRSRSCAASSRSTCWPRWRSIQQALPHLAPSAAVVDVTSDAAVEAYAGWGGYGSSKAALDHLTAILAAEHPGAARLRRRPRRHAHRRCTRRRSRARTSPTGRRRRTASQGSSRSIEGSLPSGRYRARRAGRRRAHERDRVRRDRRRPTAAERADARDDVSLLVASRGRRHRASSRFAELPRLLRPATCSWSTPRRRSPPRCPRDARRRRGARAPLDAARTAVAGSSSCAPRSSGRCAPRRSPASVALPGGGRLTLAGAVPRQRAAARGGPRAAGRHGRVPRPPRSADPLRRPRRGLAAERVPDRLRARGRQRGDAERRTARSPTRSSRSS